MVLGDRLRRTWLRPLVHALALLPLASIIWRAWRGTFVADPVREMTTLTGRAALTLLLASLACTPVATILGFRSALTVRRALGLYSSLYAGLHFLIFAGLDYRFDLRFLVPAIFDQLFILPGMAAALVLLVLAATSTQRWQKRLGKGWKRLHLLAYLAGMLAVLHFAWLVKDRAEPLRYGVVLALLLLLRLRPVRDTLARVWQRLTHR